MYAPEHLAAAKRAAAESAILLKNNGILPLKETVKTVAVVGPMADAPYEQMGTWVFDGDKAYTQTPLKAIQAQYGDKVNVIYEAGLDFSRDKIQRALRGQLLRQLVQMWYWHLWARSPSFREKRIAWPT